MGSGRGRRRGTRPPAPPRSEANPTGDCTFYFRRPAHTTNANLLTSTRGREPAGKRAAAPGACARPCAGQRTARTTPAGDNSAPAQHTLGKQKTQTDLAYRPGRDKPTRHPVLFFVPQPNDTLYKCRPTATPPHKTPSPTPTGSLVRPRVASKFTS